MLNERLLCNLYHIIVFIHKNYLFFGVFYIGNLFIFFYIIILIIY